MLQPICPGLHYFSGLRVGRVYLIDDADGYTLIDTSIGSAAPKILQQLSASGRKPSDVRRILITHAHPDHTGSTPALKAATGAQVWASAIERPVIEGREPIGRVEGAKRKGLARFFRPPATVLPGADVDRELSDGECLEDVMGGLQVVFTPGHAPGHLAFWQPAQRILFCGDVIFRTPNMRLPYSFLTVDMDENKRSIARLAALEPSVICFGHGDPLTENAAAHLRSFAQRVGAL
jgi:glyoxylase-like metal-dependent hydrolase (beta-lactamase superfamily II)